MSNLSKIVDDPLVFPRSDLKQGEPVDWSKGATPIAIKQAVRNILSPDFEFVGPREIEETGVAVYDELSKILPFSDATAFFWKSSIYSLVSLLERSRYSVTDQVAFTIYFYARILGFMGKPDEFKAALTLDGSPAEFTWHFPIKGTPKPGFPDRPLVVCLEPAHPRTGQTLHGTDMLEYLTSPQGHLGMIDMYEDSKKWCNEIESFLYSHKPEGRIPDNRRYGFGFYLMPGGKVSLKTFYGPPFRTPAQPDSGARLHRRDGIFHPLGELLPNLHPTTLKPFSLVMDFFNEFSKGKGPTLLGFATDVSPVKDCRFKTYCHTHGASLADAKNFLTLGGRLSTPSVLKGVEVFENLWHAVFPEANGSETYDINVLLHRGHHEGTAHHKVGGLLYYFDIKAEEDEPVIKVFIPVGNYLPHDAAMIERLQVFCDRIGYNDPLNRGIEGWVEQDITKTFRHRSMETMPGLFTQLSFGLKRKGWEVAQYYSPEFWIHAQNATQ